MMGHVGGGRMKSKISFNPIANSSTDMSNNSDTGPPQRHIAISGEQRQR